MNRKLIIIIVLLLVGISGCGPEKHTDDKLVWMKIADVPAFPRADKPIFLYISQNNCQYCGTMEEEIFTRPEIAWYLNEHFRFVNINMDTDMPVKLRIRANVVEELDYRDFWNTFHLEGLPAYYCFDSTGQINGIFHGEQTVTKFKQFLKYVHTGQWGHTHWNDWEKMPEAQMDTIWGIF